MASVNKTDHVRRYFEVSETGVAVEEIEEGLREIPFGEFLVERRAITREQLFKALTYQDWNPGQRVGEVVATLGFVPRPKLHQLLSEFQQIPQVEVPL